MSRPLSSKKSIRSDRQLLRGPKRDRGSTRRYGRPVEPKHPFKRSFINGKNRCAGRGSIDSRTSTPLLYTRTNVNFDVPPLYRPKADGYYVPPGFEGLDDASVWNGNKEGLDAGQWITTASIACIPVPGAGSYLPHLYIPFVAHLFFRSVLVVWLAVLLWAVCESALYWSLKRYDIPVEWPTKRAIDPDTGELYEYVDHEELIIRTALWNPLWGTVGMLLSWYSVRLFNLEPFRSEYDWLLVLFFVLVLT